MGQRAPGAVGTTGPDASQGGPDPNNSREADQWDAVKAVLHQKQGTLAKAKELYVAAQRVHDKHAWRESLRILRPSH